MFKSWSELEQAIINCRKCLLYKTRRNAVPGEGSKNAKLMFIGEAPGAVEDETGRPFVGAAGKLLTDTLEKFRLKRSEVYITNVIKCRPPGNRDPRDEEIENCSPYLESQILLIKPLVIVALGRFAAIWLLKRMGYHCQGIMKCRGRVYKGLLLGLEVSVIPTIHPAAALYNPRLRPIFESDLKLAIEEMALKERKIPSSKPKAKPKSLLDFISLSARKDHN
ncbi:MAG: uracil-DNA glycosylase [Thermoprotei archaeon]|nr:MAG: uracil-DNA glycosylase [Thermoprotei archaeon]